MVSIPNTTDRTALTAKLILRGFFTGAMTRLRRSGGIICGFLRRDTLRLRCGLRCGCRRSGAGNRFLFSTAYAASAYRAELRVVGELCAAFFTLHTNTSFP